MSNVANQAVWTSVFTVSYSSATVITYTAGSSGQATIIANSIIGRLARWTSANGSTIKHGFVRNATAASTTVTINLYGEAFLSDDTNFRLSMSETIKVIDWYIPGQQVADGTNPVGKWYYNNDNMSWRLLCVSAYVGTAAVGAGAALTYGIYEGTTDVFNTNPSFGTSASVLNSLVDAQPLITGGTKLTLRTPTSAGATNYASDLYVMAFYSYDNFWSAV